MSRILFTTFPFPGFLHPHMAVASNLSSRGHQVAFYTGPRARDCVESAGLGYFPFDPSLAAQIDALLIAQDNIGANWTRPLHVRKQLRRFFVDTINQQLIDLRSVQAEWAPDVIVCDPAVWAPFVILHESTKIPVVLLSYVVGCTLPGPDAPRLGLGLPPPRNRRTRLIARAGSLVMDWFSAEVRRAVNELRRGHGLSPLRGPVVGLAESLPLYLVPSCSELDFDRRDLPPNAHYVGPLLWYPETDAAACLDDLPKDIPWVHATEGTIHMRESVVLHNTAHGLADMPIQVILTTGGICSPEELGLTPLPPNVAVERWVNHDALLPRLDVLICTGGAGVILAALHAGVPIIAVPTEWDHADNAQRMVHAGAGLSFPPRKCTPKKLRQAVEKVLGDPAYRRNAERLSAALRRRGGAARAADLIEEVVLEGA